jgi:hypothetical protein
MTEQGTHQFYDPYRLVEEVQFLLRRRRRFCGGWT